jgi:antagonist of KipI
MLDTIQDHGRHGYSKWGINPCGAMDQYAAAAANVLVGNAPEGAVIEMHFPASELLFKKDALISLAGGDFVPHLNSKRVPMWRPIEVKKDTVLSFQNKEKGFRCYLAVSGGYSITPWLGSTSTHLKVGAGGIHGRPLKKGDEIFLNDGNYFLRNEETRVHTWSINHQNIYNEPDKIAFLPGKEWNWLTSGSQQQILSDPVGIESSSDRMGYYLKHEPLQRSHNEELLSSAVNFGTIQILPSGKLVVLMADHQTTGGYPRMGHIVTSHLPKLSQLGPHDTFTLHKISMAAAEKMVFSLHQELKRMQHACREKLDEYYAQH